MCSHSKRDGREYYLLTAVAALFGGVTVISFIYSSYFVVAIRTEPSDSYLRTAFTSQFILLGFDLCIVFGILLSNVDFRHIVNIVAAEILLPDDDVLELIYDYGYDVEQIACQLKSDINLVNMKTEILRYKGYDLRQGEFRSNFLK